VPAGGQPRRGFPPSVRSEVGEEGSLVEAPTLAARGAHWREPACWRAPTRGDPEGCTSYWTVPPPVAVDRAARSASRRCALASTSRRDSCPMCWRRHSRGPRRTRGCGWRRGSSPSCPRTGSWTDAHAWPCTTPKRRRSRSSLGRTRAARGASIAEAAEIRRRAAARCWPETRGLSRRLRQPGWKPL